MLEVLGFPLLHQERELLDGIHDDGGSGRA